MCNHHPPGQGSLNEARLISLLVAAVIVVVSHPCLHLLLFLLLPPLLPTLHVILSFDILHHILPTLNIQGLIRALTDPSFGSCWQVQLVSFVACLGAFGLMDDIVLARARSLTSTRSTSVSYLRVLVLDLALHHPVLIGLSSGSAASAWRRTETSGQGLHVPRHLGYWHLFPSKVWSPCVVPRNIHHHSSPVASPTPAGA